MLRRKVATPIILNGAPEGAMAFLARWAVLRLLLGFYYITERFVAQPDLEVWGITGMLIIQKPRIFNAHCRYFSYFVRFLTLASKIIPVYSCK